MNLFMAVRRDDAASVREVLDSGAVGVDDQDPVTGLGAIHVAVHEAAADALEALLECGADPDSRSQVDFETALCLACREGHTEIAVHLVQDWGANAYYMTRDGLGPLHLAVQEGHLAVVHAFLEDLRIDPDIRTSRGLPGTFVALDAGLERAAVILLDAGANPCARDTELNRSLTHMAAACNAVSVLRYLAERGKLEVDAVDAEGRTPLHAALMTLGSEAVDFLLTSGADPSTPEGTRGWTALHCAVIANGDPNLAGLMTAIVCHHMDRSLLDTPDNKGRTAQILASQKGHLEAAKAMERFKRALPETGEDAMGSGRSSQVTSKRNAFLTPSNRFQQDLLRGFLGHQESAPVDAANGSALPQARPREIPTHSKGQGGAQASATSAPVDDQLLQSFREGMLTVRKDIQLPPEREEDPEVAALLNTNLTKRISLAVERRRSLDPAHRPGTKAGEDGAVQHEDELDKERYRRKSLSSDKKDRLVVVDLTDEHMKEHEEAILRAKEQEARRQGLLHPSVESQALVTEGAELRGIEPMPKRSRTPSQWQMRGTIVGGESATDSARDGPAWTPKTRVVGTGNKPKRRVRFFGAEYFNPRKTVKAEPLHRLLDPLPAAITGWTIDDMDGRDITTEGKPRTMRKKASLGPRDWKKTDLGLGQTDAVHPSRPGSAQAGSLAPRKISSFQTMPVRKSPVGWQAPSDKLQGSAGSSSVVFLRRGSLPLSTASSSTSAPVPAGRLAQGSHTGSTISGLASAQESDGFDGSHAAEGDRNGDPVTDASPGEDGVRASTLSSPREMSISPEYRLEVADNPASPVMVATRSRESVKRAADGSPASSFETKKDGPTIDAGLLEGHKQHVASAQEMQGAPPPADDVKSKRSSKAASNDSALLPASGGSKSTPAASTPDRRGSRSKSSTVMRSVPAPILSTGSTGPSPPSPVAERGRSRQVLSPTLPGGGSPQSSAKEPSAEHGPVGHPLSHASFSTAVPSRSASQDSMLGSVHGGDAVIASCDGQGDTAAPVAGGPTIRPSSTPSWTPSNGKASWNSTARATSPAPPSLTSQIQTPSNPPTKGGWKPRGGWKGNDATAEPPVPSKPWSPSPPSAATRTAQAPRVPASSAGGEGGAGSAGGWRSYVPQKSPLMDTSARGTVPAIMGRTESRTQAPPGPVSSPFPTPVKGGWRSWASRKANVEAPISATPSTNTASGTGGGWRSAHLASASHPAEEVGTAAIAREGGSAKDSKQTGGRGWVAMTSDLYSPLPAVETTKLRRLSQGMSSHGTAQSDR